MSDTISICVMASCRCSQQVPVPAELLVPGQEKALATHLQAYVDAQLDGDVASWTPENFCADTAIYVSDYDIEILESVNTNGGPLTTVLCRGKVVE